LNLSFFSSRCETILENQEKVNRDMVTSLDITSFGNCLDGAERI